MGCAFTAFDLNLEFELNLEKHFSELPWEYCIIEARPCHNFIGVTFTHSQNQQKAFSIVSTAVWRWLCYRLWYNRSLLWRAKIRELTAAEITGALRPRISPMWWATHIWGLKAHNCRLQSKSGPHRMFFSGEKWSQTDSLYLIKDGII